MEAKEKELIELILKDLNEVLPPLKRVANRIDTLFESHGWDVESVPIMQAYMELADLGFAIVGILNVKGGAK